MSDLLYFEDFPVGRRFDCGSKAGYIEANLALALDREDMGEHIRKFALAELGVSGIAAAA